MVSRGRISALHDLFTGMRSSAFVSDLAPQTGLADAQRRYKKLQHRGSAPQRTRFGGGTEPHSGVNSVAWSVTGSIQHLLTSSITTNSKANMSRLITSPSPLLRMLMFAYLAWIRIGLLFLSMALCYNRGDGPCGLKTSIFHDSIYRPKMA